MVVPADPSKEFKMTRWIAFALLPVMGALFDAPLAPDKAPVDVIVIDSVDRPSEN